MDAAGLGDRGTRLAARSALVRRFPIAAVVSGGMVCCIAVSRF